MSNGPIGGVPGVEYPLTKDRPPLPKFCWNCGADTSVITPSQPFVMMVPDVAGVPRPHYRYVCNRCGVIIQRNIPGVDESGVWAGSSPSYGDMFKSDYATGQGQANPNAVDHAKYADAAPGAATGDMLKSVYAKGQGQINTTTTDHAMYADVAGSIPMVKTPYVRVRTVNDALNGAVPNGGALRFDTVDTDQGGYTSGSAPYDRVTVPVGGAGLYVVVAQSSTQGNQGVTIGMGIAKSGVMLLNAANQYVTGPSSVTYVFMNPRMQIGYLNDGDYLQLLNSGTGGTSAFTNVFMAMARIGF